jgi:hypothetical protein
LSLAAALPHALILPLATSALVALAASHTLVLTLASCSHTLVLALASGSRTLVLALTSGSRTLVLALTSGSHALVRAVLVLTLALAGVVLTLAGILILTLPLLASRCLPALVLALVTVVHSSTSSANCNAASLYPSRSALNQPSERMFSVHVYLRHFWTYLYSRPKTHCGGSPWRRRKGLRPLGLGRNQSRETAGAPMGENRDPRSSRRR